MKISIPRVSAWLKLNSERNTRTPWDESRRNRSAPSSNVLGEVGNGDDLKKMCGVSTYLNRDAAQCLVVDSHVEKHFRKTHFGGWWFRFRRVWKEWSEKSGVRVIRSGAVLELPAGEQAKRGGRHYGVLVRFSRLCGPQTLRRPKRMETRQWVATMRAPVALRRTFVNRLNFRSARRGHRGCVFRLFNIFKHHVVVAHRLLRRYTYTWKLKLVSYT